MSHSHESRIEILESKTARAAASASAATLISTATCVALSAYGTGLQDGTRAWVQSLRTYFTFRASAANLTADGITVLTTSAGGASRWERDSTYSDSSWRLGIRNVYIDPQNTTGRASNEAQGIYSGAAPASPDPLLSWAELQRRWGHQQLVSTDDTVAQTFQVHVLSNGNPSDVWNADYIMATATYPRFLGEAPVTVLAGVLDNPGGYTAHTPTVPVPGGTPASIKVGATNWAPYLGKRIRFTATGAVAYILKDLGGGTARISPPVSTNEAGFALHPTFVNPAQGAAFVVEDLTQVYIGDAWAVRAQCLDQGYSAQTNVKDIRVMADNAFFPSSLHIGAPIEDRNTMVTWYQCVFDRWVTLDDRVNCSGCRAVSLGAVTVGAGQFTGGAVIDTSGQFTNSYLTGFGLIDGLGALDYYTTFQGQSLTFIGAVIVGGLAVFDAPVDANFNPGGHGILVGGHADLDTGIASVQARGPGVWYGSGNTGKGVRIGAGSKVTYQSLPNTTGATGNFQLGDAAVGFAWNPATPAYQPGGGITLDWASVPLALGAGFAGSAHNPAQDAHLNQASST